MPSAPLNLAPVDRSLAGWLAWLESLHATEIDLGLGRVKLVAEKLGLLEFSATVVTVAGTNGKGSFVKAMTALLTKEGKRIGAYTSPHIERYNERIALNGHAVSDQQICSAFDAINHARQDISLTYFEFGTLAALLIFKQAKLDVILLEVGLGGRLDAVNIVDPNIAVITSIALDHQDWLGNNREAIGAEKAGILRDGIPFVCVESEPTETILQAAMSKGCDSYYLGQEIIQEISGEYVFPVKPVPISMVLSRPSLPVPSLLAAAQVYFLLGGSQDLPNLGEYLSSIQLEGRFERLSDSGVHFILDVAHNPQAATYLAEKLKAETLSDLICVVAAMKDKDIPGIIQPLYSVVKHWVCTEIPNISRSAPAANLAGHIANNSSMSVSVESETDPVDAIERAVSLSKKDGARKPILILGSFFMVSEFKNRYLPKASNA